MFIVGPKVMRINVKTQLFKYFSFIGSNLYLSIELAFGFCWFCFGNRGVSIVEGEFVWFGFFVET